MDDTLQKYFVGRDKRLDALDPDARSSVTEQADASGDREGFIDKTLVGKWIAQRTGKDFDTVYGNLDALVHHYFGANMSASSAYDSITKNYSDWDALVTKMSARQNVDAATKQQEYDERIVGNNAVRSVASGAAGGTLSIGEGFVRQLDLLGQGPSGSMPLAMSGVGPIGYVTPEEVRAFQKNGPQPGTFSGLADNIWAYRNTVTGFYDVDPRYAESIMGRITSGAGSILPQIVVGATGNAPLIIAALESQSFSNSTDDYWKSKGITPEQATPEQRQEALGIGLMYAIPSAAWNKWGLDNVIGKGFKGFTSGMTIPQILSTFGKRIAIGGSSEAASQVADDVWQNALASMSYDKSRTVFSKDDVKNYFLDALAAFVVGGGTSAVSTGAQSMGVRKEGATTTDTGPSVDNTGVLWQPKSETPYVSPEELSTLAKNHTVDGTVNDDEIASLCEDPAAGKLLVEAVNGNKESAEAYNALMVQRATDASPEMSENEMASLSQELNAEASDVSISDDGKVSVESGGIAESDIQEFADAIESDIRAQGIEEGENKKSLRERAVEIARALYSPTQDALVISKASRALGFGHLSKEAERILLERARGELNTNIERVYGKLAVDSVRESGRVRLEKALANIRERHANKIIATRQQSAMKTMTTRIASKVKDVQARFNDATKAKASLPYGNAKQIESYINSISERTEADTAAYNDAMDVIQQNFSGELDTESGRQQKVDDAMKTIAEYQRHRLGDSALTPEEAASMWANLVSIVRDGRQLHEIQKAQADAAIKISQDAIVAAIVENNSRVGAKDKTADQARTKGFVNGINRFLIGQLTTVETANTINTGVEGAGATALHENTSKIIEAAGNVEHNLNRIVMEDIQKIAVDNGVHLGKASTPLIGESGRPIIINGQKVSLSQGLAIYAYSKSDTGKLHLIGTKTDDGTPVGGTKWGVDEGGNAYYLTSGNVESVVDSIPESFKKFADGVIEYLSSTEYSRINSWFKQRYGIDLPKVENYFPIRNLDNVASSIYDMMMWNRSGSWMSKGFTKSRTSDITGFESFDFLDTLARHITNVNHVISHDAAVRHVEKVLGMGERNNPVKNAMDARSPALWKVYTDWLDDIKVGRTKRGAEIDRYVQTLRKNVTTAYLGWRLSSGLKVFGSFGPGAQYVRPSFLIHTLFQTPVNRVENIHRMMSKSNSAEVKSRADRYNQVMRDLSEGGKISQMIEDKTGVSQIDAWMFMRIAEINQTSVLWNSRYDQSISEHGNEVKAISEADWVIQNTQQSGQLQNLPTLHRERPIIRALVPFQNDVMHNFNTLVRIMVENGTPVHKAKRLVSYAVYSCVWPATVLAGIGAGDLALIGAIKDLSEDVFGLKKRKKPKTDAWDKFRQDSVRYGLEQPLAAIPLLNNTIDWAIAKAQGNEQIANMASSSSVLWENPLVAVGQGRPVSATMQLTGIPLAPYVGAFLDKPSATAIKSAIGEEPKKSKAY